MLWPGSMKYISFAATTKLLLVPLSPKIRPLIRPFTSSLILYRAFILVTFAAQVRDYLGLGFVCTAAELSLMSTCRVVISLACAVMSSLLVVTRVSSELMADAFAPAFPSVADSELCKVVTSDAKASSALVYAVCTCWISAELSSN